MLTPRAASVLNAGHVPTSRTTSYSSSVVKPVDLRQGLIGRAALLEDGQQIGDLLSWPTGEFGGMGLEGAVKLGYRSELAAIHDPAERKALFDRMVAKLYERGKAVNTATEFEFDDVIDPAESRKWITAGLRSAPPMGKKRPCVDAW